MLKIGRTSYCEDLGQIRSYGYDAIDYQCFVYTENPFFKKDDRDFEEALKMHKKAVEEAGLVISQTHGPWRFPPQDATKAERKERFEKMVRSIRGTAILGAKHFIIHPVMPFGLNDKGHENETYEINLEFMTRLSQVGQEYGVIVCLENMPFPELSLASVPSILSFVKKVDSAFFKMCLDTGHCTMFELSPADAVRLIGKEYLCALHIHDNDGVNDLHLHPFSGVIHWDDFGNALREMDYTGVISLETKVSKSVPSVLREYEEIGLFKKAHYIASLASGKAF